MAQRNFATSTDRKGAWQVKRALIVLIFLFLCGCRRRMNNDEIIREVKKCQDAGLMAEEGRNLNGEIEDIQCAPKEEARGHAK